MLHVIFHESDLQYGVTNQHRSSTNSVSIAHEIMWGSLTLVQLQLLRQAMQLTCNVNMQRCTGVTLIRSQARGGSLAL